ncbi:hypothetical protein [Sphingomonas oryzagri]
MSKMRWDRANKPRDTERAFKPKKQIAKGGWTHLPRQPVKVFTPEEIAAFQADRDAPR